MVAMFGIGLQILSEQKVLFIWAIEAVLSLWPTSQDATFHYVIAFSVLLVKVSIRAPRFLLETIQYKLQLIVNFLMISKGRLKRERKKILQEQSAYPKLNLFPAKLDLL